MSDLDSQVPYWDAAAATKTFTHPLHLPWLDGISRHAAILDYGCGYGRIMKELEQRGFGGTAHADDDLWINRTVGVYSTPYAASSKVAPDLHAGDTVAVNCWTVGGNVGTYGDVWYHAVREGYTSGETWIEGWVFAPFVDGAGDFHTGAIPKCP